VRVQIAPVVVEHAGVDEWVFGLGALARAVGTDDQVVRVRALRIFVEILEIEVGGVESL
jgi:hypothetical protein